MLFTPENRIFFILSNLKIFIHILVENCMELNLNLEQEYENSDYLEG